MLRGKKKDLYNLEIDLGRRNQPKDKSKRTLENKIVELCHSLCGISTEQIVLVFQCVLQNLGREDLISKDQTEKIVLDILESIKHVNQTMHRSQRKCSAQSLLISWGT